MPTISNGLLSHTVLHTFEQVDFLGFLGFNDILALASVNKVSFASLKEVVENRATFIWDGSVIFQHYAPKKLQTHRLFNGPVLNLPKSVTHMTFSSNFNHPVLELPSGLVFLKFGMYFNQSVSKLPSSVQELTFGLFFNTRIIELPGELTHLTFGGYFDQPLPTLPDSLKVLTLGEAFNQPLPSLPEGLTHLTFVTRSKFDQKMPKLPGGLTRLTFGDAFNHFVADIPQGLTHLRFGRSFNQPVSRLMGKHLIHLHVGKNYVHKIPTNLERVLDVDLY